MASQVLTSLIEINKSAARRFFCGKQLFGIVVFGFGIVPFILNLHDSMAIPQLINLSLKTENWGKVYVGYVVISNGILPPFKRSWGRITGNAYQFFYNIVQILTSMTVAVAVMVPLIVIPCGKLK